MLAEGAYAAPTIIYLYFAGEGTSSRVAENFKALTALLRRYAETACGA